MRTRILIAGGLLVAVLGGCLYDSDSGQVPTATSTGTERPLGPIETATAVRVPVVGITPMPPPFPDRSPEPIEDCDPDQPIQVDEDSARPPPGPSEELAARGELVLTARVVEVLPSRWTTPDGSRPKPCLQYAPFGYWLGSPEVEIVTPVIVEFDGKFIGGDFELLRAFYISEINLGDQLALTVAGGEIDGDEFTNDRYGHSPYAVGDEVVLSLVAYRPIPNQTWGYGVPWHRALGTAWIPVMKWTVSDTGVAVADYNGSDPAELLLADLLDHLRPVAPVFPTVIPD